MIGEIGVNVGYSCNNNCMHCFLGSMRNIYPDRTKKEIISIIDEAKEMNVPHLTIIGGDPTIRKDFFEILSYAEKQGFEIYLETNSRTFSVDSFARKVFKISPDLKIGMSFHSSVPEIHDKITQVKGSWAQSVKGIRNMKKYGLRHLRVNCPISKINYQNLPKLAKFLAKLKVNELSFYHLRLQGNAFKNIDRLLVKVNEIQPYLFDALEISEKYGIDVKTFGFPYCMLNGYERFAEEREALRGYMSGTAQIFNELTGKSDWQRDRIKSLRAKSKDCVKCKYFNICEGIWKEYLIYNYEKIEPVRGNKIKSLKELKI